MRIPSLCLLLFSTLALGVTGSGSLSSSDPGQGSNYKRGQQTGRRSGQQRRVQVQTGVSKGLLKVGERGSVTIIVENTDDARILEVPQVPGLRFDKPGQPTTNSSTRWVNGRVTRSFRLTWQVFFRVDAAGDFDIPPFILEVQGQRVGTRPLAIRAVKDMRGEDLGFLKIRSSSARVVEGQPFTLELSFGWDPNSQVTYANLYLPWWGELPGTLELEQPPLPKATPKVEGITINRKDQTVAEKLDSVKHKGRSFQHMRLVRSFIPTRPGTLEIPTSSLEFGRESRTFRLFENPKRQGYIVQAEPFTIEVIPLPTEGQPFDFSGAVGSFDVRSSIDTRDAVVGDSMKLVVEWSGAGNLEFFEAPDLARVDAFNGFLVYGRTEEKTFERRRVTYDIAPLSQDVTEIPPVRLSFFDPVEEIYTAVESDPIAIRVRPLQRAASLGEEESKRFERDIRDIDTRPIKRDFDAFQGVPDETALFATMAAVPLLWLGVRTGVRRRRGDPSAPRERRRRKARKRLGRALRRASDAEQRLRAFQSFLAARTGESEAAWIGRDLKLQANSDAPSAAQGLALDTELLDRGSALLRALEHGAWGAAASAPPGAHDVSEILKTADALLEAGL